jgi:hypothetical protein
MCRVSTQITGKPASASALNGYSRLMRLTQGNDLPWRIFSVELVRRKLCQFDCIVPTLEHRNKGKREIYETASSIADQNFGLDVRLLTRVRAGSNLP